MRKADNTTSNPSHRKVFGVNSLQLGENDASKLIGGIFEKGFSESANRPAAPALVPRPTVLPFPVARHRSRGPHWMPNCRINNYGGEDEDEEDAEDAPEFDLIADFAHPVQRKEKKGLDFSRWRELMNKDSSLKHHNKEEIMFSEELQYQSRVRKETEFSEKMTKYIGAERGTKLQRRQSENDAEAQDTNLEDMETVKQQDQYVADMAEDRMPINMQNDKNSSELSENLAHVTVGNYFTPLVQLLSHEIAEVKEEIVNAKDPVSSEVSRQQMVVELPKENVDTSFITSSPKFNQLGDGQKVMSLENQIDAENRAQLKSMSALEIAEAQAEIMEKLNPSILEVLKRRGQDKLRKKNFSGSDESFKDETNNLSNLQNRLITASTCGESSSSHQVTTTASNDTQKVMGNRLMPQFKSVQSSSWDVWSQRVEAARHIRFSLDGNVIERVFTEPATSNISADYGYSSDNVSERDFLRTEGNPGAAGYSIKEAIALTRSVIPGQRALALNLLASLLDKALHNICQNDAGLALKYTITDRLIDWEAIWAYALGPEPELALSLRMCLDDNHNSVVLACSKVIQCVLSCDINETLFEIVEKMVCHQKDVFTAPIFRSTPVIEFGFLRGGFWKYNTKPSNILPFSEEAVNDKHEGEHTIQDDVVVSGQDCAAGLVRMGILPRICYLLETDPSVPLEECLISILIAIARHSPTCGDAIMECQRLVQTIVDRFVMNDPMEITPAVIKSVTLLKVLATSARKNCVFFIENGIFRTVANHLFLYENSFDKWLKSGRDNCRLSSALLVEQLRFLKVSIQFGHCCSYFSDLFPALCIWLDVPDFGKLIENNILYEFAAVTREAYIVLESLARRLPNFYSHMYLNSQAPEVTVDEMVIWKWNQVGLVVDLALNWMKLKSDSYLSKIFDWHIEAEGKGKSSVINSTFSSLLWVISAIIHMLASVLANVIPEDTINLCGDHLQWLPEFVSKIGFEIIGNGFLSFQDVDDAKNEKNVAVGCSFLKYLCHLRHQSEHEISIASVYCIQGLFQVVVSVNKLMQLTSTKISSPSQCHGFVRESTILANGILESCLDDLGIVLTTIMNSVSSEWLRVQSIEVFGRGGPAPGVGVGCGAAGGGFLSTTTLLAQMDSRLLINMLEIFQIVSTKDSLSVEAISSIMPRLNSALGACLILGPEDASLVAKALDILLEVPFLKYMGVCIHHFLHLNEGFKIFSWTYTEEDYVHFSNILASHFRNRWLSVKKKLKAAEKNRNLEHKMRKKGFSLDTIHENLDSANMTSNGCYSTSLVVEWARQRLPLPMHWFLSPITTINYRKLADLPAISDIKSHIQDPNDFVEVAKCGLFYLLCMEATSALYAEFNSPLQSVPIVWKLHSLSVALLVGMDILEEEKSRDVYEALQELYGQLLERSRFSGNEYLCTELLNFQSEIHESYSTFIDTLVEQFCAASYADILYGRQITIYLLRCVEAPVRLAAWNSLSNAHALDLLPAVEKCVGKVEGYLQPAEENEKILEAYVKSWVSGALDRAATRKSVAFTLSLHHLSSFIFGSHTADKIPLRNKLSKSMLRDCTRKPQHEGMLMDFIQYNVVAGCQGAGQEEAAMPQLAGGIEYRFKLLRESCDGISSLLSEVQRLESSFRKTNML